MIERARDRRGHEIYLTEERWQHICEGHPEMREHKDKVLDVIRHGRRRQETIRSDVYRYYRNYPDLPEGNTTVVAVVRFGLNSSGEQNNFVLTAYQIEQ